MSNIQGKSGRTTRKLAAKESSQPATGVKLVRALHEAEAGDTVINLTNLTVPASAKNYSAPSVSDLTKVNLQQFADNVTVRTSSGTMLQNIDYVISGASTISLIQPALDNEVFEIVINAEVRTGRTLVDGSPLVSTGALAAGATDYNVGTPFEVGKYTGQQVGAVMVFAGGQLKFRNEGNQPDGEGDYYEVHAGSGLGTIIRFNSPLDLVEDTDIQVVSVGSLIEKPNGSQLALIEVLQGQLDAVIPTLAQIAGVPESDFQATPNNVDLKAFGDRVLEAERLLVEGDTDNLGLQRKNKVQTKILSANVSGTTVDIADLRFNNLTIGKFYEFRLQAHFTLQSNGFTTASVIHNGVEIGRARYNSDGSASDSGSTYTVSATFQATATTLTVDFTPGGAGTLVLFGDGTRGGTYHQLEERNDLESTTDFT